MNLSSCAYEGQAQDDLFIKLFLEEDQMQWLHAQSDHCVHHRKMVCF